WVKSGHPPWSAQCPLCAKSGRSTAPRITVGLWNSVFRSSGDVALSVPDAGGERGLWLFDQYHTRPSERGKYIPQIGDRRLAIEMSRKFSESYGICVAQHL